MTRAIWTTAIVTVAVASAAAQDVQTIRVRLPVATERQVGMVEAERIPAVTVQSRFTAGAPYSAEAVTESVQTLADGNRIVQKTVARVYRDGEGRTRRETVDPETGAVRSVTISDPVAKVNYTLDPANRIAHQTNVVMVPAAAGGFGGRGRGGAIARVDPEIVPSPAPTGARGGGGGVSGAMLRTPSPAMRTKPAAEDLGTQTIEGVAATGSRTTTVIPAGAIGNLQQIKVVSEQWTAPDLKVLVLTKHSDPRAGETSYRLVNIVRAEPDRALFLIPSDYTLRTQSVRREQ